MKGKYLKYLRMLREVEFGPYPQVDSLIRQGREVAGRHSLPTLIVALALAGLAGLTAVADPSGQLPINAETVQVQTTLGPNFSSSSNEPQD